MSSNYSVFPAVVENLDELLNVVRWLRDDLTTNPLESDNAFTWRVGRHRFPYGIWFRGEQDSNTQPSLLPGIFRKFDDDDLVEAFINNHLQTRIPELAAIQNSFDRLCMAQHYNIPTRLLDWTENFLTAAFFATASKNGDGTYTEDGALYVLNAYTLNQVSAIGLGSGRIHMADDYGTMLRAEVAFSTNLREWLQRISNRHKEFSWDIMAQDIGRDPAKNALGDEEKFDLFRGPIAVMPTRANPRMLVQGSTFTIHGGCNWANCPPEFHYTELPETTDDRERRVWLKCTIPANTRPAIEEQLFALGIHQSTMFPELDTQRGYLMKVGRRGGVR